MHSRIYYNPETNQIKNIIQGSDYCENNKGFVNLGHRKVAEAFTCVSADERKILWTALNQDKFFSFDFSLLNSKIRHKIRRLGLYQLGKRYVSPGKTLLNKINNKKCKKRK